jgi:hypothetical protein
LLALFENDYHYLFATNLIMRIVFIIKKNLVIGTFFLNKAGIEQLNGRKPNPFAVGLGGLSTLLALCVGLSISDANAQPSTTKIADRILATLRAASESRSKNAQEAHTWKEERQRLNVLHQTVTQRIVQQEARAKKMRAEVVKLDKQNQALEPQRANITRLEILASNQARLIAEKLHALSLTLPPGVVPEARPQQSDPLDQLQAAMNRLEATENNLSNVAVELSTGILATKSIAVEVLRVGGAAAWWRSLDGKQAGQAEIKNGQVLLSLATSRSDRKAILMACDIAKGRAAPSIIALPFRPKGSKP